MGPVKLESTGQAGLLEKNVMLDTAVSVTRRKLNIGFTTRAKFNRLLEEGDITHQQVD